MSIQTDVIELQQLDIELKNLRKRIRVLSEQKSRCENRILEYLDANDQPGLKMNGTVIMAKPRQVRKYQKKDEKMSRGENVLRKHGVFESREALAELMEAMRGVSVTKPVLKIY